MKKLVVLALLLCLFAPALAKSKKTSLTGWVSDMNCARKSVDKAIGPGHAECARKCAAGGDAMVFISDPERRVYGIDNAFMVRDLEGQRVAIVAETGATADTLHVISVMPKEDSAAAPGK